MIQRKDLSQLPWEVFCFPIPGDPVFANIPFPFGITADGHRPVVHYSKASVQGLHFALLSSSVRVHTLK
jgi:hypothetical protein